MIEYYLEQPTTFSDLPREKLQILPFGVYVLDKDWNYLLVSDYVPKNLGLHEKLEGQNMWVRFPSLITDASFRTLKDNCEAGIKTNLITTSPLTSQRLHIFSYLLTDCYVFFAIKLTDKNDLINELRQVMANGNK